MNLFKIFSKKSKAKLKELAATNPVEGKAIGKKDNKKATENPQPRQQKKRRKSVARICCVCLQHFHASRSDAMYCSGACRQSACMNGVDMGRQKSLAEHILMKEVFDRFEHLLQIEGEWIYTNEVYSWIVQSDVVKRLLFPFLNQGCYSVELVHYVLDPFYKYARDNIKPNQNNLFQYSIPPNWKEDMIKFIDAYNNLKKSVYKPKVIYINC